MHMPFYNKQLGYLYNFSYICIGIGWSSYQLTRLTQWAFPFF